jgi:hypothetical protein
MRTMLRYCVVAALALAGCANQALQKAQQAYATGIAACKAREPGETKVAFADCVTNVENETLRPFTRYPDLLDLKQAKRKELGEEIDAGRLTKAQANAQLTEILTHIDNIEAQRSAVAASVAAQQAAALGASSYAPPAHTFKDYMPDAQS